MREKLPHSNALSMQKWASTGKIISCIEGKERRKNYIKSTNKFTWQCYLIFKTTLTCSIPKLTSPVDRVGQTVPYRDGISDRRNALLQPPRHGLWSLKSHVNKTRAHTRKKRNMAIPFQIARFFMCCYLLSEGKYNPQVPP